MYKKLEKHSNLSMFQFPHLQNGLGQLNQIIHVNDFTHGKY